MAVFLFLFFVLSPGAVVYRVPLTWGQNKLPWKLLHAALMLGSLIMSILGLCAVFAVHNAKNTPNLYSLHSWIGITAIILFALQVPGFKRDKIYLVVFISVNVFFLFVFPDPPLGSGGWGLQASSCPALPYCSVNS